MFSIFKNDVSKRFPLRRGIRGRMFPSDYGIFFSIFSFFFYQKYTLSSRASEGSEGSSASALFILILFLTLIPCFDLQFCVFRIVFSFQLSSRSEEHTSELQSRPHLVCRLLLEKKNSAFVT